MAVTTGRKFQTGASTPTSGTLQVNSSILSAGIVPGTGSGAKGKRIYQGGSFNRSVKLVVTNGGTPQMAEPMGAPVDGIVRIRTYENNIGFMFFAESKEALRNGQATEIGAGFEIIFPYHKGRLWFMGEDDGDYAVLSARSE